METLKPRYFGAIDCHIDGGGYNVDSSRYKFYAANEVFISLFNVLNSDDAKLFGIERIAYNTGSNLTSKCIGMDYWDSSTPAGENAWATFMFKSASVPFYVHMQASGHHRFGSGSYYATMSNQIENGLGLSFALRFDKHCPWTGTTLNQGRDDKGLSGTMWYIDESTIFPRTNSEFGVHSADGNAMIQLVSADALTSNPKFSVSSGYVNTTYTKNSRAHFVFDYENFFAAVDVGNIGAFNFVYFGKYSHKLKNDVYRAPYVCFAQSVCEDNCVDGNSIGYYANPNFPLGSINLANLQYDGQSSSPKIWTNGGIVDPQSKKVVGVAIDTMSYMMNTSSIPDLINRHQPSTSGEYAMFNIPVMLLEASGAAGGNDISLYKRWHLAGEITFVKFVSGISTNATINSGTFCVLGPTQRNAIKLAVPWSPSYKGMGKSLSRDGHRFIKYGF